MFILGGTPSRSYYGTSLGFMHFHCWGNETSLMNCTRDGTVAHPCVFGEVATIICQGTQN